MNKASIIHGFFRSRQFIVALVAIAAALVVVLAFFSDRCEVIDLIGPNEPVGHRYHVYALVDPAVLSFRETRSSMTSISSAKETYAITLCTFPLRKKINSSSTIFSFGRNCQTVSRLGRRVAYTYFVFPIGNPPTEELDFESCAVLLLESDTSLDNNHWLEWCLKHKVPLIKISSKTDESIRSSLSRIQTLRKPATD